MAAPLSQQVIVVTGASSGIGLVTARAAARRGARVVLAARNADELERAVVEIRQGGGEAIAVPTDVADYAQVEALAQRAAATWGRIDTWVNNAAVGLYATFRDTSVEDFRRVIQVNLMGQVYGAKAALPYLEESAGTLVCVGSVESDRGVPFHAAYAASKHAVKGWLDAFRVELEKDRSPMRVVLVKPASINTPFYEHAKTQLGVRPKAYPPVYAPELVADAILHAAEHGGRDIYVGTAGKAISTMERLNPRLPDLQFRLTGYGLQKSREPKGANAPSNLYAPLAGDGGVRGRQVKLELRRSLYPWLSERSAALPLAAALVLGLGLLALRRAS